LFAAWTKEHNKTYATADETVHRFNVWKRNLDVIMAHNEKVPAPSFQMGMNQFGDVSAEEWRARFQPLPRHKLNRGLKPGHGHRGHVKPAVPASWDWRDHNAVGPIDEQGQCASAWIFATNDAVTGWGGARTGKLIITSTQELFDCATSGQGCSGGTLDEGFQWVASNGGLCSSGSYPVPPQPGPGICEAANCTNAVIVKGIGAVYNDEAALLNAVSTTVTATAIEADSSVFQFYTSGIIDDPSCGQMVDHVVANVGWGVMSGDQYWILKNSWGTSWGLNGYVLVARGKNMCGIATESEFVNA